MMAAAPMKKSTMTGVMMGLGMCLLLLLPLPPLTSSATFEDYRNLAADLFTNYSKELQPVEDSNYPLDVYVGMWLNSIQELDEIRQQLTFSALLEVYWFDPNLRWDPSLHNGTTLFTYPQQDLWVPDLTIQNSMESMEEMGFDRNYLFIWSSGKVKWTVGGVYKTSCAIDVTYYPFDAQRCDVIITTLVSTRNELDVSFSEQRSLKLDWYSESGSWELEDFTVGTVSDTSERTMIAFTIHMRRLRTYYVVTVLIPVLLLSLTSTLVFALPADSGEKMGTSITVLLAFAVYLSIVADQMPRTSTEVSLLAVYLTLLLGQTALGVLISVWIINLHFRDDAHPPGRFLRKLALLMRALMLKGPRDSKVAPAKNLPERFLQKEGDVSSRGKDAILDSGEDEEPLTWKTVSYLVDRFLFYFFSLSLFLITVIFVSILAVGN